MNILDRTIAWISPEKAYRRMCYRNAIDAEMRSYDVGRILRTFKIKKNVEVTDNGKIII